MSHIIDPLREAVEVVWKVIDSVSVHAKRMQANGGVNLCKSKTPDNKTQEGSLKTGGSSKILTLPTESHRYTDKHTLHLQQVFCLICVCFLKGGFICSIFKLNLINLELK